MMVKVPSDIEIAQSTQLTPITEIASRLGLDPETEIDLYGRYKAKVHLDVIDRLQDRPKAAYVVVTAITPTPLGEGKTVTTVGLGQALNHIGLRALSVTRQPSMGPTFGIKGGAAGGGYAQVLPMVDINLHFTGDIHAVGAAHNLLAALVDSHLHFGNELDIDPYTISWRRVLDVNDRALRQVVLGLGGKDNGVPRESGFDITVASEVMAVLALARNLEDMRERLSRMVIGFTRKGQAVTAGQLKATGAMTLLLRDAIMPNLVQTVEGTPAIIHCGPFGNIAHGNSSVVADLLATRLCEIVVTESGFGSDLGFEKFCNIKCRTSGLEPDAAVVVCTLRALKMHGGVGKIVAGKPLDEALLREDMPALEHGCANLVKHIENVRAHGIPAVVAINRFTTDTDAEIELVKNVARKAGAFDACVSEVWEKGGAGGEELARAVVAATKTPSKFEFLYPLEMPLVEKMRVIAQRMYGADDINVLPAAAAKIKLYEGQGMGGLPVCMAKAHLSLSHDGSLLGRPSGFVVPIRDLRLSAGAGFIYPLLGDMRTMPGLSRHPAAERVDIEPDGRVVGLF